MRVATGFWSAAELRAAGRYCERAGHEAASAWVSRPRRGVLERTKRARYGLGAERRLTQSVVFERLLKQGARKSVAGFTFYLGRRDEGLPRLGILVSRKHSARATDRNRIKRCIREAFRLEQESLGSLDVLVRPPFGIKPSADMIVRLRELLSRLNR